MRSHPRLEHDDMLKLTFPKGSVLSEGYWMRTSLPFSARARQRPRTTDLILQFYSKNFDLP